MQGSFGLDRRAWFWLNMACGSCSLALAILRRLSTSHVACGISRLPAARAPSTQHAALGVVAHRTPENYWYATRPASWGYRHYGRFRIAGSLGLAGFDFAHQSRVYAMPDLATTRIQLCRWPSISSEVRHLARRCIRYAARHCRRQRQVVQFITDLF